MNEIIAKEGDVRLRVAKRAFKLHRSQRNPATKRLVIVADVLQKARWRPIGYAVMSWAVPASTSRDQVFGRLPYGDALRRANRSFTTLTRLFVRPSHRNRGIAQSLIRECIRRSPTPLIEAWTTRAFLACGTLTAAGMQEAADGYFIATRAA